MIPVIESENATSALYMLPAYIRTTSMVACIIVMILGIVGNLMVILTCILSISVAIAIIEINQE